MQEIIQDHFESISSEGTKWAACNTNNELLDSIPLETPRFRQAKSDSSESLNESEIEDLSDASFMKAIGSKLEAS